MGFDYQTAADLACGRPVSQEKARNFAQHARWTHDDRESLTRVIADLRREIALRDGEIALLKEALLEHEAAGHNALCKAVGEAVAAPVRVEAELAAAEREDAQVLRR